MGIEGPAEELCVQISSVLVMGHNHLQDSNSLSVMLSRNYATLLYTARSTPFNEGYSRFGRVLNWSTGFRKKKSFMRISKKRTTEFESQKRQSQLKTHQRRLH